MRHDTGKAVSLEGPFCTTRMPSGLPLRFMQPIGRVASQAQEIIKNGRDSELANRTVARAGDISRTGHASLYGIYFDTDKADVKPQSDAALLEIAKLLEENSALKLYVVGDTDNVGQLNSNGSFPPAGQRCGEGADLEIWHCRHAARCRGCGTAGPCSFEQRRRRTGQEPPR
jgi:hypothetical protein